MKETMTTNTLFPLHDAPASEPKRAARTTKKDQITSLFLSGMTNLEELATMTDSSISYIGSVLQQAGLMTGYFDLYTTTANPMNVYSKFFVNKLGFRNEETARRSVENIDRLYRQFEERRDRAGQHHALDMALVMFDRARFTGKAHEAEIFRRWLVAHLLPIEIDDEAISENAVDVEADPAM